MNSRLEQFVRDHREEFDAEEPDNKLWEKIRAEADPRKKKRGILIRLGRAVWAVAAVVLLAVASVWYFSTRTHTVTPTLVQHTNPTTEPTTAEAGTKNPATVAQQPTDSSTTTNQPTLASIRPRQNREIPAGTESLENTMDEEMYHYAKLVEIKENQLKTIEKDEPLLYKQFASDVSKLDSVYHSLQSQLPKNPNREQLLEAMLQNLQLQMGLLNHQLDIIKQINHSKKTAYEEAHKTA
ncbi:MAG TPA: hypothetical protein VG605_22715 [Puia sp.]|nr:hypothetical protein [Puia sp.]